MLGVCWTPSTVAGAQKMATTMPSNPEQLLGAILVRKDIFQRFESTMHDTCLDANNLLEYLFSLYNSTATPSERENFPTPQSFNLMRRGGNSNRGRKAVVFGRQPGNAVGNSYHPVGNMAQGQTDIMSDTQQQQKKVRMDSLNFPGAAGSGNLVPGAGIFHQQNAQLHQAEFFGAAGGNNNGAANIKMEQMSSQGETPDSVAGQAASPLPPFSQIRRHGGGQHPYSPAAIHFSPDNSGVIKNHPDGNVMDTVVPPGLGLHTPGTLDTSDSQAEMDDIQVTDSATEGLADVDGDGRRGRRGRKKRTHQCFCGALFTRADNLKRHIRKCHEEKLEKLNSAPQDLEIDSEGQVPGNDIPQSFTPVQEQGEIGSPMQMQGLKLEHHQQENLQLQQQQPQHQLHHHHQFEGDPNTTQHSSQQPNNNSSNMVGDGNMRWSCFCGKNFDDHRQLVDHTRTHENNT